MTQFEFQFKNINSLRGLEPSPSLFQKKRNCMSLIDVPQVEEKISQQLMDEKEQLQRIRKQAKELQLRVPTVTLNVTF